MQKQSWLNYEKPPITGAEFVENPPSMDNWAILTENAHFYLHHGGSNFLKGTHSSCWEYPPPLYAWEQVDNI